MLFHKHLPMVLMHLAQGLEFEKPCCLPVERAEERLTRVSIGGQGLGSRQGVVVFCMCERAEQTGRPNGLGGDFLMLFLPASQIFIAPMMPQRDRLTLNS